MSVEPLATAPARPATTDELLALLAVAQRELATERVARQRAVFAREETLAVVSHDLRNPLNAIAIAVHELLDGTLDAATRDHNARAIVRAVARSERLIRALLDAGRIDAGRLVIEPRPIALATIFEQVAREHTELAQDAGTPLALSIGPGVDRVLADHDRLLQVLGNLIGNAIRHARSTGTISLSAALDGERVGLTVDDHGPGIAPEALPDIFDRYSHDRQHRRGGAGLGLAIAQGIVAGHGGVLTAGRAPGAGARFHFTLARA
jgi:signal transduction histidine kinase